MIDWDRVEDLRSEIGAEDFLEVVELFLDESEEVIERFSSPTSDAHEQAFHFLKGSAMNLGFVDFARACAEAERKAASGAVSSLEIEALTSLYMTSREILMAGVFDGSKRPAALDG